LCLVVSTNIYTDLCVFRRLYSLRNTHRSV